MAKTGELPPGACSIWYPGDHLCERGVRHCGQCMCKCGHRWDRVDEMVEQEPRTITLQWTTSSSPELEDAFLAFFRRKRDQGGDLG